MGERLTAEDFIAEIAESVVASLLINSQQEMELVVQGDMTVYVGPDPISLGHVDYMVFLGKIEEITGLQTFTRAYMQDRLR